MRILGVTEDVGNIFGARAQKDSLATGGLFRGYSEQISFWLGCFTLKARAIDAAFAGTILSLTTLTDIVVLALLDNPARISTIVQTAHDDTVSMRRALVKREVFQFEKLARTVFEAGAFFQEERAAPKELKKFGLAYLAVNDFVPP